MARPSTALHAGLDLGGTFIKSIVVEHSAESGWQVVDRGQVDTPTGGPDAVVSCLADVAAETIGRWADLATVGVGVPGLYDPGTGAMRMLPNLEGDWDGVPLAAVVRDRVGLPVAVINDARAFGLAELRLGAGRGATSLVGLTLGTGVGGVIAVDGRVVHGHDGTAGELGHQTMEADGLECTCGSRGCLEAYARADRLEALSGAPTAEDAVARARAGDERALAAIAEIGKWLGIGIANMIVVMTPDRVVIGGGIGAAFDLLLEPIWAEVRARVTTTSLDEVEIVPAQLGTWAGAIGAAVHGAESVA